MTDAVAPGERARFAADLAAIGVRPGDRLAVAVSGGPDSLALLLLAAAHGDTVAATVDHGLRAEAAGEAAMVADLCTMLGVRHATLRVSVERGGGGIQAAAREARYRALEEWARHAGAAAIATAHHADDQAETLLMRAARGAGIGGLAGVRRRLEAPLRLPVVRPLLGWRRQALALIVTRARLRAVQDPSNDDDRFDRTRIRRVLAGHEDVLRPDRIASAAAWLAEADAALEWAADKAFAERAAPAGDGESTVLLDPEGLPAEILRRVVRDCFRQAGGAPDRVPTGPETMRLIERVRAGTVSTLGDLKVSPGRRWRFALAPPHRSG